MQVSPRLAELLGLAPPLLAFPAGCFFALVQPNDIALLRAAMSEAIATGAALAHEFRVRREDNGELRFLCHEGRVVERDLSGAATILAGASHDVTERRLKQEASELLNRASHRSRIAVVWVALPSFGERRPETSAYIAAFQARLNNLAAAHDLLIQAEWARSLDGLPKGRLLRSACAIASILPRAGSWSARTILRPWRSCCTSSAPTPSNMARCPTAKAHLIALRDAAGGRRRRSRNAHHPLAGNGRPRSGRPAQQRLRHQFAGTSRTSAGARRAGARLGAARPGLQHHAAPHPAAAEAGKFGRNTCLKPVASCSFLAWLAAKRSLQRDQGLPR